jgi:hypothetical protein
MCQESYRTIFCQTIFVDINDFYDKLSFRRRFGMIEDSAIFDIEASVRNITETERIVIDRHIVLNGIKFDPKISTILWSKHAVLVAIAT